MPKILSLTFQDTESGDIELHYFCNTKRSELHKFIGIMKGAGFQLLSKRYEER